MMVPSVAAAEQPAFRSYEDTQIRLRLFPRTTEQMAAFFEARGFPQEMRAALEHYCFFTVVIDNKSQNIVRLDLQDWHFSSMSKDIRRIPRSQWPPLWQKMNIPLSSQSTFRWTLLPERLDFQVEESEGGNVIVEKTENNFSLRARFSVAPATQGSSIDELEPAAKNARSIIAQIDALSCGGASELKAP